MALRFYSIPIRPAVKVNVNDRFKLSKWHFAYLNVCASPDFTNERKNFVMSIYLWQKSKPIIRIPLSRYVVWKITTMMDVILPYKPSLDMIKRFNEGKAEYWKIFERLYQKRLKEVKKKRLKKRWYQTERLLEDMEITKNMLENQKDQAESDGYIQKL